MGRKQKEHFAKGHFFLYFQNYGEEFKMGNKLSSRRCKSNSDAIVMRQKSLQLLEERALSLDANEDECKDYLETPFVKRELQRTPSIFDQVDKEATLVRIEDYNYPFENLIFEGGGNKGLAYVGSIRCLEELGLMKQIKRVAGSSAGAITAALVALGYNSRDIEDFLSDNIEEVFLDHSCGYLSLLPNLLRRFGWNPGKAIYKWFGDKIQKKSAEKNPDMTFYDLYKERNMELCVVVTNLNQMRAEYCHIKTTPDMPIREALRMSMAIPGIFSARVYDNHGQKDTYVDGGVLCNYPIHCYDGWYLSLTPEDSFLQKMTPLKDLPYIMSRRFEQINEKSLGFLLYDDTEMEVMRFNLERRVGSTEPIEPSEETKLYKKKQDKKKIAVNAQREHNRTVRAVDAFMNVLKKYNLTEIEFIDKNELASALQDKELFPDEYSTLLFGPDIDVDKAFSILDKDGNGRIAFIELVQFIEAHGIRMQTRFQGYGRREVDTFFQFLSALQSTLLTNLKFVFVKTNDEDRTVGINTGHVGTSDYVLEEADRDFVVKRGYNATRAFLKYYVADKKLEKRPDWQVCSKLPSAIEEVEEVDGASPSKSLMTETTA
ncbi:uncharacterized protein LOC106069171 isoform X2 [Biomphalaria glabrata]|nr:uncharacterized protein LOC106069171 isoform X2 [Biomphalaria glabrata]